MASVPSLRHHLVEELNDLLDAERQLTEALPQMAQRAERRELKAAFRSHLAETRQHVQRAADALRLLGEKASGKTCEAMKGLLEEGQELMDGADGGALRDAMMITAAQKVEHYEIATYGTARTYAQVLGEKGVARLLAQTLKDEKAADRKLTRIAEAAVNRRAAEEWHEAVGVLEQGAKWIGSAVGRVLPRAQAADRTRGRTGARRGARRPAGRKK